MAFAKSVRAWADRAKDAATNTLQASLHEAAARLIERTPFRTGRARAGYRGGVGGVSASETTNLDKNGTFTLNHIDASILTVKLGDSYEIVNGVPYIVYLERGTHRQAAIAMFARTRADWPQIVRVQARKRGLKP